MKKSFLSYAIVAVMAAFLYSCGGRAAKRSNSKSNVLTSLQSINDTTKIIIDQSVIDSVKLLFGENRSDGTLMLESDYSDLADYLSTAVYDTVWNDSGIMVKMLTPDYTAIISYKDRSADNNDWLMVWEASGRTKFRQKWFFIAEDQREGLFALLEKYSRESKAIEMAVFPERNGGAPETLELTIKNNTEEVIQFGADYSIERLVEGKWIEVDLGDFAVIAIMYGVQPGESGKYTVSLFTDRVSYPEGDYRVVKSINIGEREGRPYYADFKIIEPR